jgi:hypothetical protein
MANVPTVSPMVPLRAATAFAFIAAHILKKRIASWHKRQRRWWMKEIFCQRFQYGNRLMRDMQVELVDDLIMNFTRMTSSPSILKLGDVNMLQFLARHPLACFYCDTPFLANSTK